LVISVLIVFGVKKSDSLFYVF